MAGEITVTYSPRSKGWSSFFSYHPDWMLGLNSTFYTWKNGNLYEHDRGNAYNSFYRNFDIFPPQYFYYPSSITTIFNQDPTTNKMFKTIALESTDPWSASIVTDLNSGLVQVPEYLEKEGEYFAYIRNPSNSIDPNSLSTQGVGIANTVDPLSSVITFQFEIPSNVGVADKVYKLDSTNNNAVVYLGNILSINGSILNYLPDPLGTPPLPGQMIFIVKNNIAESYGVRGYYMEVLLEINTTGLVELFEVSSSAFKSFP